MATEFERHPVHAALYKPVLFMGLPRPILLAEGTMVLSVSFVLGGQWVTLVFVAVVLLVVHPLLVYASRNDPEMIWIFIRALFNEDYYEAQPHVDAPRLPVRPSVPKP